jgi:glycine/D-amino acid oxidase-like deaminating enzyme
MVEQIRPLVARGNSATLAAGAMLGAYAEITADKNSSLDQLETDFRIRSSTIYPNWLSELGETSNISVKHGLGTFIIANTFGRNDLNNINAIEQQLISNKAPFELVNEKDVPSYYPNQRYLPRKILWLPQEGFVDTISLTAAIDGITETHVNFSHQDAHVDRLLIRFDRVCGVVLENGITLEADHVVIAAGVGTQSLLEQLPDTLMPRHPRLMPGKGTALILQTELDFPYVLRSPNRDFACGLHIVPRGKGMIYVGATNRTAACPGTSPGASVEEVHDLLHQVVHEFNTHLDSATFSDLRVGNRPICVDGYPLVGATDCKGLSIATGTYRNGVLMAPLIARVVADEIANGGARDFNPFSPRGRGINDDALRSSQLFQSGAEGIVSFLPSPHGLLPYKRADELTSFLSGLLELAIKDSDELTHLRNEVRTLIREQPMTESFAQLFFMLGDRYKHPYKR